MFSKQTLERRVCALERASPNNEPVTIIRRIVDPGRLDAEFHSLRADDGELWTRLPGETEQDLTDRASGEVRRNRMGIAILTTE